MGDLFYAYGRCCNWAYVAGRELCRPTLAGCVDCVLLKTVYCEIGSLGGQKCSIISSWASCVITQGIQETACWALL
jgi:hypothetical protein